MMKRKALWSFILAFLLALPIMGTALAAPPPPHSSYGTVKVNGTNVTNGTITAWINGTQYGTVATQMWNGDSVYSIDVPGDDSDTPDIIEGGVAGDTIIFKIDGQEAEQTATWASGTSSELNLTAGGEIDAKFICTPLSGAAPLEVTCEDESTGNITGWSWDLGDGTTSTDQNPAAHTYNANGSYTVSLTVMGPDGSDTETKVDYISLSNGNVDDAGLICDDAVVYPNGTVAVSLMAQGIDVYGLQTTVEVSDPALVDLLDSTFGDFFTQPIAMASNQKDPITDSWLGGASQQNPNGPVSGSGRFATLLYRANGNIGDVTLTINSIFSDRDGTTIPSQVSTCALTIQPFGDIAGLVAYQGRNNHAAIDVTAAGPSAKNTTTNTSGAFTLEQLPDGTTYQVTVDAQSYLPTCTTATIAVVSGQTTTLPNTKLRGGDLDDNLIINIGDATRLSANFNNPASADIPADINADGTINIGDWSILQGNYDLAGCQTWPN